MIVGLHHTFIYFLNLVIDAKDFTLKRSSFHIFRPKAIKLLSPYFEDLRCLTRMSSRSDFRISFRVKYVFHETRIDIIDCFKNFYR